MTKLYHALRQIITSNTDGMTFLAIVLGTLLLSMVLSGTFFSALATFSAKLLRKMKWEVEKEDFLPAKKPLKIFFVSTATYIALYTMASQLTTKSSSYIVLINFAKYLYRASMIVVIAWILFHLIPILFNSYLRLKPTSTFVINPILGAFAVRALQMISIFIAIIAILSEVGINVNGLITGLGLGGLTFALAAQDTASNLFGGVVILSDKPFAIGDWIQTSEVEGVVEDITFRSTRIRTFDDALVVLPNSKLSNTAITNWSKMSKRRMKFTIGLNYSTNPNDLKKIIAEIKDYLVEHPDVASESVLVRLDGFGSSSLDILIQSYLNITTLAEMKKIREEINYKILEIVTNNNSSFAFPSTTVYMSNME